MRLEVFKTFTDNLMSALRTASALLLGNAALVYHGVVGSNPNQWLTVAVFGLVLSIFTSMPWTAWLKRS